MKAPRNSSAKRSSIRHGTLLALAALAAAWTSAQPSPTPASLDSAYHLSEGSIARSQIVALGRDMVVDGEALSHAVVMGGSIYVNGRVTGDVVVIEGDIHLGSTARLEGDAFVVGGRLEIERGAAIAGRSLAYPDAAEVWTTLIQGPTMGLPPTSPIVLGAKLALLAFWAFLIALLLSISGRGVLSTSESIRTEPFRNFFVGLTGITAMVLTALLFSALSGTFLGLPLLVLVGVVALVLRFWGMVAVFHALGEWLDHQLRRTGVRSGRELRPLPIVAATYGLLVLGVLKFLPWVGIWSWSLATFIGVGAALTTKLGRREPWLNTA